MDGFYTYQQFPQLITEVTGDPVREACTEIFHRPATVIIEAGQQPAVKSSWLPRPGHLGTYCCARPSWHEYGSPVARGDQL